MRKIYLFCISLSTVLTASCDFLDVDESVGRSKEFMYSYFDEVKKLVTNVYAFLPSDWGTVDGALRESASDNAVHVWSNSRVYNFYTGSWSPYNTLDDAWSNNYTAIRAANSFLESFSPEDFEKFENNENYDELMKMASYYPWEVRFLRAFFHFELAKRYGDIPLVTKVYTKEEANRLPQTSFHSVIDFITRECDEAAKNLPSGYGSLPGAETGRITQGACMALKSKALLYAASKLHNPEDDPARWEKAAEAAWAVIDSAKTKGWYRLEKSDKLWGCGNIALLSKQLILERRGANSTVFEEANFPIGYEGGNTGTCPTQNLVDAFEMSNGEPFDWDNPVHAKDPYKNRDPRLDMTLLYNGATWLKQKIETFEGGRNGAPLEGASLTGYYLKKYLDPDVSLNPSNYVAKPHHYIIFRYGEILLNYAEAMNEWKGPDYTESDKYKISAKEALNEIRTRVDMPAVTVSDKEGFTTKLRNERRIELAFEDHRFWDIRRWMTGSEAKEIYGVRITKTSGSEYTYERVKVQDRVWDDKMYLYPIPQEEVFINGKLVQNKGWAN